MMSVRWGSLGENKALLSPMGEKPGHMDGLIQSMCARYVHDSMVITRNVESRTLLSSPGNSDGAWHRHRLDV